MPMTTTGRLTICARICAALAAVLPWIGAFVPFYVYRSGEDVFGSDHVTLLSVVSFGPLAAAALFASMLSAVVLAVCACVRKPRDGWAVCCAATAAVMSLALVLIPVLTEPIIWDGYDTLRELPTGGLATLHPSWGITPFIVAVVCLLVAMSCASAAQAVRRRRRRGPGDGPSPLRFVPHG